MADPKKTYEYDGRIIRGGCLNIDNNLFIDENKISIADSNENLILEANGNGKIALNNPLLNNISISDPTDNLTDGMLYYNSASNVLRLRSGGAWITIAAGSGAGNVIGPGSGTDNAVALFNGTSGTIIKDSVDLIYDTSVDELDIQNASGKYKIDGDNTLTKTTLGTNVVTSSLTTVGVLNSGSITSGFGTINTGSSSITSDIINGGDLRLSGNTLSSTNLNGNIILQPTGTGVIRTLSELCINTGEIINFLCSGTGSSDAYSIEVVNTGTFPWRFIGSEDSITQRLLDIGYYTGDDRTTGTWNTRFSVNSFTGDVEGRGNINIATGKTYNISGTSVLSANTLGSGVLSSSLTTVGALGAGSITSGFGNINNGASGIGSTNIQADTIGEYTGGGPGIYILNDTWIAQDKWFSFLNNTLTAPPEFSIGMAGTTRSMYFSATGDASFQGVFRFGWWDTAVTTWSEALSVNAFTGNLDAKGNMNIAATKDFTIASTSVLSSTTLGSSVVNSSLTSVGALNTGSITSGFGNINIGGSNFDTTGNITGGNLVIDQITIDVNNIITPSGIDLNITPGGAGNLVLDGLNWPQADGIADQVLKTDGAGNIGFVSLVGEANTGTNVGIGGVGIFKGKNGEDFEFRTINAGSSKISISLDAGNNEVDIDIIQSNITGTGILNSGSISSGFGNIDNGTNFVATGRVIVDNMDLDGNTFSTTSGDINVSPVGNFVAKGITYPSSDGTIDQVMTTNGSGTLSFNTLPSELFIFGSGDRPDLTPPNTSTSIVTNTTLTHDVFYENLTVTAGVVLRTDGYRIFVRDTLTIESGAIINNSASGSTEGQQGSLGGGGPGVDSFLGPSSLFNSLGGTGGPGTYIGGTAVRPNDINGGFQVLRSFPNIITGRTLNGEFITGGGGGSGTSGLGGGGGGLILIVARRIVVPSGSAYINANGATSTGGGGGGGGVIILSTFEPISGTLIYSVLGGIGTSGSGVNGNMFYKSSSGFFINPSNPLS